MLLSSCAEVLSQFAVRLPLELRKETQSSSRVLVLPPLELQQPAWGPFELWQGTQGSSRVAAVDSGLNLSCGDVLCSVLLKYRGTRSSSPVAMESPSSVESWDSELLLSCGDASSRVVVVVSMGWGVLSTSGTESPH